ncbi:50S ribosomal protein L11 methyltransferase [Sphingomonas sp.]|uniref:50S ribosomal protein L11 methyltransferase n=1 Tax=Sphingomonas sp. TaxID=28214 RepID=UPI001D43DA5C|nr:50S ribosomal protein L11 methyltransferase [Sphingomonas sp.]MBX9796804.1 50S ribosomal protein L11 methyltransferase [Sphingomonas sp.]
MNTKAAIDALLPQAMGNPAAMLRIAEMMVDAGRKEEAAALAEQALPLADAPTACRLHDLIAAQVPAWHFLLVRDRPRNAAYRAAIKAALTRRPGARVLEIGTGTGLLALYAAEAGAVEVVTCEANPLIARAAAEVIAANGWSHKVRVIAEHSTKLDAARDMGWRADILVSEIIANDLLSEQVLPAHEHAMGALVADDAIVIPVAGVARVALVEDTSRDRSSLGHVDGFDLSAFNRFVPWQRRLRVDSDMLMQRSDVADLFCFDLASANYAAPGRATVTLTASGGRATGVLQWLQLDLGGGVVYENLPGHAPSNWAAIHHRFAAPINTRPGQPVRVHGMHDRSRITVWTD